MLKKIHLYLFAVYSVCITSVFAQTTIEQRLSVVLNEGNVGGNFQVALEVKGTNLPVANTLGSATIDISYDNSLLTYVDATPGPITFALGYSNTIPIDNTTSVRFGPLGSAVGPGEGSGYDLTSTYSTWVTLNFTIINPSGTASLVINDVTNQIGLYDSHSNSNNSGIIINQTLSTPINIESEPLPVELSSFTASAKEQAVELLWRTETEINSYGFEILRISQNEQNWDKIGFVAGHGNSNSPQDYQFLDKTTESGKYSYKLKQIDNDGQYKFSPTIDIDLGILKDYFLDQNYPNPFNPKTVIKFGMPRSGFVKLQIYNLLGEEVMTLLNEYMKDGIHNIDFNPSALNSGVYVYRLEVNDFVSIKKMVYIK